MPRSGIGLPGIEYSTNFLVKFLPHGAVAVLFDIFPDSKRLSSTKKNQTSLVKSNFPDLGDRSLVSPCGTATVIVHYKLTCQSAQLHQPLYEAPEAELALGLSDLSEGCQVQGRLPKAV